MKKTKHLFAWIGAAVLVALFCAQTVSAAPPPTDMTGSPYERAVRELAAKDIITGDTDGRYHPDKNLTRAEFCCIVVKAMAGAPATVEAKFSDMGGYDWAAGYIGYAAERGVTAGYGDGSFRPGNDVTTDEMITMALRAAGYNDVRLINVAWPRNYIAKATDISALDGLPSPLPEKATKGMAAQFVRNVLGRIEAANLPSKNPPPEAALNAWLKEAGAVNYGQLLEKVILERDALLRAEADDAGAVVITKETLEDPEYLNADGSINYPAIDADFGIPTQEGGSKEALNLSALFGAVAPHVMEAGEESVYSDEGGEAWTFEKGDVLELRAYMDVLRYDGACGLTFGYIKDGARVPLAEFDVGWRAGLESEAPVAEIKFEAPESGDYRFYLNCGYGGPIVIQWIRVSRG
jgi:hypothetical protein